MPTSDLATRARDAIAYQGAEVTLRTATGEATVRAHIRPELLQDEERGRASVATDRYRVALSDAIAARRGDVLIEGTDRYMLEHEDDRTPGLATWIARKDR